MDQATLVTAGHALVTALDEDGIPPRMAMFVHNSDTDTWKLWIVPPKGVTDKHDFYRRVAVIMSKGIPDLAGFDVSDTEMVLDTHPAIKNMKRMIKVQGAKLFIGDFQGNTMNGYRMPDGLLFRVDI